MHVYVIKRTGRKHLFFRWFDPHERRWREKTSGLTHRRKAERAAVLFGEEVETGYHLASISWEDFRERYEEEHQAHQSRHSMISWKTAADHLQRYCQPKTLEDITASGMSKLKGALNERGCAPASIRSYLRTLRAALGWAQRMNLLRTIPNIELPKRVKGASRMARSRSIVGEELDRLIEAAKAERPKDTAIWQAFIKGLYHSGLRISELMLLSWTLGEGHWMDESGDFPLIRIAAEGEKASRDRYQPVTPEFWDLVKRQPRRGLLFPLPSLNTGQQIVTSTAVSIISRIGRRAGIITDPKSGKCATSHDIGRRAMGTRLASVLKPQEHAKFMRHEKIDTTMDYYVQPDAVALSRRIWGDRVP